MKALQLASLAVFVSFFLPVSQVTAQSVVEILDSKTGGGGSFLSAPEGVAVGASGSVFIAGSASDNVFEITPTGVVREIIDASGDGAGAGLDQPTAVAVGDDGSVYVTGQRSDNVFRIDPGGSITEILDRSGDGLGNLLRGPTDLALDSSGSVVVCGIFSDNVFRVTPQGLVTEILDATGDGLGNDFGQPRSVATDDFGNVYASSTLPTSSVFRVRPSGLIQEIIDRDGDGSGNQLLRAGPLATDAVGNVFVVGLNSDNAFRITPEDTVTEIIDSTGDGVGNGLSNPNTVATDASGNVFVGGFKFVFKVAPSGAIDVVLDEAGDGLGNVISLAQDAAVSPSGRLYVSGGGGSLSDSVMEITPAGSVAEIADFRGTVAIPLLRPQALLVAGSGELYVAGSESYNVVVLEPDGSVRELIDKLGDGQGNRMERPSGLAIDGAGNVFVMAWLSNNVFRVSPSGVAVELIDSTGDGLSGLDGPRAICLDPAGNLYVAGSLSHNVFQITPQGQVTEIINSLGAGVPGSLNAPYGVAADSQGQLYVTGQFSNNVFRVDVATGVVTELATISFPNRIVADPNDNVYLSAGIGPSSLVQVFANGSTSVLAQLAEHPTGFSKGKFGSFYFAFLSSSGAAKLTPAGEVVEFIDATGDGLGNTLWRSSWVAPDGLGNVYVAGEYTDNVFRVSGSAGGAVRAGSGVNPTGFAEVTQVVIGENWETTVNLTGLGSAVSLVQVFFGGPTSLILGAGELLCMGPRLPIDIAAGAHSIAVPNDGSLIGLEACAQAATMTLSPSKIQLQNAIDLRVGSF